MFRRAVQFTKYGSLALVGGGFCGLYIDRPKPDLGQEANPIKEKNSFPELFYAPARVLAIGATTLLSNFYLRVMNHVEVHGSEILANAVLERNSKEGLITVSNHSSTVDDPALFASIFPWWLPFRPSLSRWSLCSQEYCFEKGDIISTLFYAGKVVPIKRGLGVDQRLFESFFNKLELGQWVHIFPEGKIDQSPNLGGRDVRKRGNIGRLKWGVGKLIARATVTPVVIPFYHIGMENVIPQDHKNNIKSMFPHTGQDVNVRIGEPIHFDDLIEEFRKNKSHSSSWGSSDDEKELYSAITLRIEKALLELESSVYEDKRKRDKLKLLEARKRHERRLVEKASSKQ